MDQSRSPLTLMLLAHVQSPSFKLAMGRRMHRGVHGRQRSGPGAAKGGRVRLLGFLRPLVDHAAGLAEAALDPARRDDGHARADADVALDEVGELARRRVVCRAIACVGACFHLDLHLVEAAFAVSSIW